MDDPGKVVLLGGASSQFIYSDMRSVWCSRKPKKWGLLEIYNHIKGCTCLKGN